MTKEIELNGCIEVGEDDDIDDISDQLQSFLLSKGWFFGGDILELQDGEYILPGGHKTGIHYGEVAEETLRVDNLLLRKWQLTDAPALYNLTQDYRVSKYTTFEPHESEQESREVIEGLFRVNTNCYCITSAETGEILGCIELQIGVHAREREGKQLNKTNKEATLGFWLHPKHWNKGYMTKVAKALIDKGFNSLGVETVHAQYLSPNTASKRVQEKLGFQYVSEEPYIGPKHFASEPHIKIVTNILHKH